MIAKVECWEMVNTENNMASCEINIRGTLFLSKIHL